MTEEPGCEMFIDGDGVPFWLMALAIDDVRSRFADVRIRAYKDWTHPGHHRLMTSLWDQAVDLVQVNAHARLSNGTDIAMAVDVVDTHHRAPTAWVALVSNDGDFSSLAVYLRRRGVGVMGYGAGDASALLAESCTDFTRFDPATRLREHPTAADRHLHDLVAGVVAAVAGDDGWTRLDRFGAAMRARHGLRSKGASARTWSTYFAASGRFEVARVDGVARVRARTDATRVA